MFRVSQSQPFGTDKEDLAMNRRHAIAGLAAVVAGAATVPTALAAVPPPADPRDRPIPLRSWEVYEPVPALRLDPGDSVTEWVNTHEMNRHRGDTLAKLPVGSWPAFVAAYVDGAVDVCQFTPQADPSDFLADHEPEEAIALAWERHEAYIRAHAGTFGGRKVNW